MRDLLFKVDETLCVGCGACVDDCLNQVLVLGGSVPQAANARNCIGCQHCLAVCPTGAISIFGVSPDSALPLNEKSFPEY